MSFPTPYDDLSSRTARLDRRHTGYRFDLEHDVAWAALGASGDYFGPGFLSRLGVETARLTAHPEAHALFQWAFALAACLEFSALERHILQFCAETQEDGTLPHTASTRLLVEEEEKHIALFERYAAHLRTLRPSDVPHFERHFAAQRRTLELLSPAESFPTPSLRHFVFWLSTLFFEEYTLYVDTMFETEGTRLQPAWRSAHRAHRVEEAQHIVTDVAHLEALQLSPEERRLGSKAFLLRLESSHQELFGLAAAKSLVSERFPKILASHAEHRPLRLQDTGFWEDLLTSPHFRQTRRAASLPGLPSQAPKPARLRGPSLPVRQWSLQTLPQRFARTVEQHPDTTLTFLRPEGDTSTLTYAQLFLRSRRLGGALTQQGLRPGAHVLVQLSQPEDFVTGFWGCLLEGFIPVPLAPPLSFEPSSEDVQKILRISKQLHNAPSLGDEWLGPLLDAGAGTLAAPTVWTLESLRPLEKDSHSPLPPQTPNDVAVLQFSSGSTGQPRGVRLTHANILFDLESTLAHHRCGPKDVFVSWLPLFHDMGLFGYHLSPLLLGAPQVLLSPLDFVRRPRVWLEQLTLHRGTQSAAPSFAFARLARALEQEGTEGLELSCVRCILDGAEPISASALERFQTLLAPVGLRPDAVCPAYGLAEATVAVAMNAPCEQPRLHTFERTSLGSKNGVREVAVSSQGAVRFVDVGQPIPDIDVRIVDEEGHLLSERQVGRVQVHGPNVTSGYEGDAEASASLFSEDGWLDTGDLGLVLDGRLCITGRKKDVLFVRGQNFYAHDLESVALLVPGVSAGRIAAVGRTGAQGEEELLLFLHLRGEPEEVLERLQRHLAMQLGLTVDVFVLLPPDAFPKTTSGKLRRAELRRRYEAGDFEAATVRPAQHGRRLPPRTSETEPKEPPGPTSNTLHPALSYAQLLPWVQEAWAAALGLPLEKVRAQDSFRALGGTSFQAVDIHSRLEQRLGQSFEHALLRVGRTPEEMARWLESRLLPSPHSPISEPPPTPPTREPQGTPSRPTPRPVRTRSGDEPIAIVGVALRFAEAASLDEFWSLLAQGRSALRELPRGRWAEPPPATLRQIRGGFLEDVALFDAQAFGLSEEEAREMDPQQRLFLEVAAEALESTGGHTQRVGVFAGAGTNDYVHGHLLHPARIGGATALGNLEHMVAARVSRALGLLGPTLTVNAACASSLVALHLAAQSLRNEECDVALAGGVELHLTPAGHLLFAPSGVLSASGRCLPYSAQADGFVLGEGAVAFVLKRLSRAQHDGDVPLSLIRGSAMGSDGAVYSRMATSPQGQLHVLRHAYAAAGVDPCTVGYFEGHGTATPLGDLVEVRALSQLLEGHGPNPPIPLGSVKGNLGHLFSAAGGASVAKVLAAFRHHALPKSLGADLPDARLDFAHTPLRPLARLEPWPSRTDLPRRAGVSAFGVGGTNCHLVLEEAQVLPTGTVSSAPTLWLLGAPDETSLRDVAASTKAHLLAHPHVPQAALAARLAHRSARFMHRAAHVADAGANTQTLFTPTPRGHTVSGRPQLAFVFSGPGTQYPEMGRALYAQAPVFREALETCSQRLTTVLPRKLEAYLYDEPHPEHPGMDDIACTQPVVFAFDWALGTWLLSLGLTPDAVLGHSAGEYVAAVFAGALTFDEALELVVRRGEAMARAPEGKMAAVFAPESTVEAALRRDGLWDETTLAVAAVNDSTQTVLSGAPASLQRALERLETTGISHRMLRVSCAAHSPLVAPAADALRPLLERIPSRPLRIPFFSTLTGARLPSHGLPADYWQKQLHAKVRFSQAVQSAAQEGVQLFLEVGPGASLSACVELSLQSSQRPFRALPLLRKDTPTLDATLATLGQLFEEGVDLNLGPLAPPPALAPEALPPFPYRRRRLWAGSDVAPFQASPEPRPSRPPNPTEDIWLDVEVGPQTPWVDDHRVRGQAIAPGALLLDMALRALRSQSLPTQLEDVSLVQPLAPTARARVRVRDEGQGRLVVESQEPGNDGWRLHLSGRGSHTPLSPTSPEGPLRIPPALDLSNPQDEVAALYEALARSGLTYGPSLRTVRALVQSERNVWARLELAPGDSLGECLLHPALLDGALQSLGALRGEGSPGQGETHLGFSFGRITLHAPLPHQVVAWVRRTEPAMSHGEDSGQLHCELVLTDTLGQRCATLGNVVLRRLPEPSRPRLFPLEWRPSPEPALQAPLPPRLLLQGVTAAELAASAGGRRPRGTRVAPQTPRTAPLALALWLRALHDANVEVQVSAPCDDTETLAARLLRLERPQDVMALSPSLDELRSLVQAMHSVGAERSHRLWVVSPHRAPLAYARVVQDEWPHWQVRAIELHSGLSGRLGPQRLLAELGAKDDAPGLVSLRENVRCVPALGEGEPLHRTATDTAGPPPQLREGGVYWVVGGHGGLGQVVIQHLRTRLCAKVLVTSRSPPDERPDASRSEDSNDVLRLQADVTDAAAMRRAFETAKTRWGAVHGVLHLAGVLEDGLIVGRTFEQAKRVLAPKLQGGKVLFELLREEPLDFVAFFSSLASHVGGAGQSDYAAANAALDELAARPGWRAHRVVSLAWGPWAEVGMVKDAAAQTRLRALGLPPMRPEDALGALEVALARPEPELVVAAVEPWAEPALRRQVAGTSAPSSSPAALAPSAIAPPERMVLATDRQSVQTRLMEELALALRRAAQEVDPRAPLPKLGLDSLRAVGLVRRLESLYGLRLPPTFFFEHTTPQAAAEELARRLEPMSMPL